MSKTERHEAATETCRTCAEPIRQVPGRYWFHARDGLVSCWQAKVPGAEAVPTRHDSAAR